VDNDVGWGTSIAIGADGNPMVAYYDSTLDNLNFLRCGNPSCTSGNVTTTVDEPGDVGSYLSIAIATSGLPVISYYDGMGIANLNFAQCTTTDCTDSSDWSTTTVDTEDEVGQYNSIAIGTDGLPVISYRNASEDSLVFAKCTSSPCTNSNNWSTTTLDSEAGSATLIYDTSIAIGADGYPEIAYRDSETGEEKLKFARCTSSPCTDNTNWSTTTIDSIGDVGEYPSIAIGADGYPAISYTDNDNDALKFAKCTTGNCANGSDWTTTTVDETGGSGGETSIAIGTDGLPVISYYDITNNRLKMAKCADSACSASSTLITINDGSVANFGTNSSLTIGTDGWPVISYYSGDLKVAKMQPLVELIPSWGLSGTGGDTLNATAAGNCTSGASWTNGEWYEATTTSNSITLAQNECTELAFALDTSEATASTTYRLRLVKADGSILDDYETYPALTIVSSTANTTRYSKEAVLTSASTCNASDYDCNVVTSWGSTITLNPYISVAIGTDGNPVIAYDDFGPDDLVVVKCGNPSCTSGNTTTTVDSAGDTGEEPSIAIGADGYPRFIGYRR
jgi:hypothetical protein